MIYIGVDGRTYVAAPLATGAMVANNERPAMERIAKFLELVRVSGWHSVPTTWIGELRIALDDNLVRVGFGGVIELTEAGREALAATKT